MNLRTLRFVAVALSFSLLFFSCSHGRRSSSRSSGGEKTTEVVGTDNEEELSDVRNTRTSYHPLDLKFYLERSGSMIGFDANSSKGEFKETVADLLNRFPIKEENDSNALFIVNNNVYPFEGTIRNFISERDLFAATKDIGDPSFTDFYKIFEMIMANEEQYSVSVLISDLIYSVKGQEEVNPQKLMNEAKALTGNIFKNHSSGGVWVIKFIADYGGKYYPYNSPSRGIEYMGDRPYYAMIFTSKIGVETLCNDPKYANFYHFSTLPGYQDMFFFTSEKFKPEYSVIQRGFGKKGEFRKEKGEKGAIHSLQNVHMTRDELSIPVAVNLSSVPMSEAYKKDLSNYEIISQSGFEIVKIESLKDTEDKTVYESCPGATHIILLNTDEDIKNETIYINLKYKFPRWITQSSTNDDSDINEANFNRTTFAFESMMQGIYNAYTANNPSLLLFSLPININTK
ncbi:MAG: hypothetical protein J1E16_00115 [Muribaculaceae bacterium]|nr:hypothetical protein [Muribaculaceae bacterium]